MISMEIGCDGKASYPNDQHCDKIYVNNAKSSQIASGKHYCISLTKGPVYMEIGMLVKSNAQMINVVIRST